LQNRLRLELLNPREENLSWNHRLTVALGVATATGAVVLLVVNYRKQNLAETKQFVERFGAATSQMGDHSPTVRLGGAYAMAALADEYPNRRQQCIDVLCAYLRLPYLPSTENSLVSEVTQERTWTTGNGTGIERRTYILRPHDRVVRLTIIRLVSEHLQEDSLISWQGHTFDFTGGTFDGGEFSGCVFTTGTTVTFDKGQFTAERFSFNGTRFRGGNISFNGARFASGKVTFDRAEFTDGTITFNGAHFTGATVTFDAAEISLGEVIFPQAQFAAGEVLFHRALVTGGEVTFPEAQFTGGTVTLPQDIQGGDLLVFLD